MWYKHPRTARALYLPAGVDREFSIYWRMSCCNLAGRVGIVNENGERFCP